MATEHRFPRRICLDRLTVAERAIYDAVQLVELMGADVRLTEAVILLGKARDRVADFIDGLDNCSTCGMPATGPGLAQRDGTICSAPRHSRPVAAGTVTLIAGEPGTITFIGSVPVHGTFRPLAPVPVVCSECGRGTAANGACYRCHPIPVPTLEG